MPALTRSPDRASFAWPVTRAAHSAAAPVPECDRRSARRAARRHRDWIEQRIGVFSDAKGSVNRYAWPSRVDHSRMPRKGAPHSHRDSRALDWDCRCNASQAISTPHQGLYSVPELARQSLFLRGQRKVRAPQDRVPGNAWASRDDGKWNRKHTADGRKAQARLKWRGCPQGWPGPPQGGSGKSPPRFRQRQRHAKPHPEQSQIGRRRGGPLSLRVGCTRR